jgi:hypothetical protein
MHGPSILAALQRHENTLEAELAPLVLAVSPEAGELLESAALNFAQARKLIAAEVGYGASGDLVGLAELAEAVGTMLLESGRKVHVADRIEYSLPAETL